MTDAAVPSLLTESGGVEMKNAFVDKPLCRVLAGYAGSRVIKGDKWISVWVTVLIEHPSYMLGWDGTLQCEMQTSNARVKISGKLFKHIVTYADASVAFFLSQSP